jgi:hypothetical protein
MYNFSRQQGMQKIQIADGVHYLGETWRSVQSIFQTVIERPCQDDRDPV